MNHSSLSNNDKTKMHRFRFRFVDRYEKEKKKTHQKKRIVLRLLIQRTISWY